MSFLSSDTIAALATAPLPAGVAVIRLSGPQAKAAAEALAPSFATVPARKMHFTPMVSHETGEVLDQGLIVHFPAPASFTGEDVVEIHCHGGPAVVQAILDILLAQPGIRTAQPGEFSRRAFINGKMDLTEAEGLADLIASETAEQRRQALRQLDGALGTRFEQWRTSIMELLAHVEAALDFPDEELDVLAEAGLQDKLATVITALEDALAQDSGCRLRDGFEVAIIGRPNAGKSTLTNLLTGRETAIVSPLAGTTRDVVETRLDIAGFPVTLADTAGLREATDAIEKEGVARARKRLDTADIVVIVVPAADWPTFASGSEDMAALVKPGATLVVVSHVDSLSAADRAALPTSLDADTGPVPVVPANLTDSAAAAAIVNHLAALVKARYSAARQAAGLTQERHRTAVADALVHLNRAQSLYAEKSAVSLADLLAQDLRDAAAAIGRVTGRTTSEDVLDLVFSTFCIGK